MADSMRELEDRIRDVVAEESAPLSAREELGVFEQVGASFRGNSRWLVILMWVLTPVCSIVMFYGGYRLYQATTGFGAARWGAVFLFGMSMTSFLKVWYWLELNRLSLMRDLRRVELQVAQLAARIPGA